MHSGTSLRRRLTTSLLALFALCWCATGIFIFLETQREVDYLLDAHLRQSAALLTAQSSHELSEIVDPSGTLADDVVDLRAYEPKVAFQLWSQNGTLIARSRDAPARRLSDANTGFADVTIEGLHWRVFSGAARDGQLSVQVAEDHAVRERIATRTAMSAIFPMLVALPLLALMAGWIVSRSLHPLERLGAEVATRAPTALSPIDTSRQPREIAPLVQRLNELFARVEKSVLQERRFTANAAHELRNPLAALRVQAEVAYAAADVDRKHAALGAVIASCDRLTRLVEQLLLLARVEEQHLPREPCHLDEIARNVLAELAPAAIAAGKELSLDANGPTDLSGNASLLDAAIRNLVDNALRHGGQNIAVSVLHIAGAAFAELHVSDDGPGVPGDALPRLGERFNREQASAGSGSGLGLALVSRIAHWHGGELSFANRSAGEQGLVATLRLPMAAA